MNTIILFLTIYFRLIMSIKTVVLVFKINHKTFLPKKSNLIDYIQIKTVKTINHFFSAIQKYRRTLKITAILYPLHFSTFTKATILVFVTTNAALGNPKSIDDLLSARFKHPFPTYESKGKIFNPHQNTNMDFHMIFKRTPSTIEVSVKSEATESYLSMDDTFNVLSSTFNVTEDSLIEKIQYNSRFGYRNNLDEVVFSYYLNKKRIKKKGVYYSKKTIDTFSIIPILQHISNLEIDLISADFAVPHMAIKVPIIIEKTSNSTLASFLSNYTVPDEILSISKQNHQYTIYTLKVTGWQGLIYNHRHFYIFSNNAPYEYIGHWGGPDQTNLFSWSTSFNR